MVIVAVEMVNEKGSKKGTRIKVQQKAPSRHRFFSVDLLHPPSIAFLLIILKVRYKKSRGVYSTTRSISIADALSRSILKVVHIIIPQQLNTIYSYGNNNQNLTTSIFFQ